MTISNLLLDKEGLTDRVGVGRVPAPFFGGIVS